MKVSTTLHKATLGAVLLLLAGCAAGGSARECVYDAPLHFRKATILAMQPDERRDLLTHNRNAETICR